MPKVTNANLTLKEVDTDVQIDLTYDIIVSSLERFFAAFGVSFTELVTVIGVDIPGTTGPSLAVLAFEEIPVQPITEPILLGSQLIKRNISTKVPRAQLDEDIGVITPDDDEIRCEIRIVPHNLPQISTAKFFTNQVVLSEIGPIHQ